MVARARRMPARTWNATKPRRDHQKGIAVRASNLAGRAIIIAGAAAAARRTRACE